MKICINGGHFPGLDSGAVGRVSTEAGICRELMELLSKLLRDFGFEVVNVQADDLSAVTGASNGFGAEVFLSVHCNGAKNKEAHGMEFYAMSEKGWCLSECMRNRLSFVSGLFDRGIKDGSWLYVLKNTEAVAVLVEVAFITNESDERLLLEKTALLAKCISEGVIDYYKEFNKADNEVLI